MQHEEESRNAMPCIRRNNPTTDETPPWEGITFILPVGSDMLSEHLKHAYPDCKTLRQRKHKAAIHFLSLELEEMRLRDEELPIPSRTQSSHHFGSPQSVSNDLTDHPSTSSSQQNTPSCTSPATPHSVQSPKLADRSRASADQYAALETQPPKPDATLSPQTFVFSAIDGRPLQPKTKRKMTDGERAMYKETRKRGACSKCKRMKGKCTHVVEPGKNHREPPVVPVYEKASIAPVYPEALLTSEPESLPGADEDDKRDFNLMKRRNSPTRDSRSAPKRKSDGSPSPYPRSPGVPRNTNHDTPTRVHYQELPSPFEGIRRSSEVVALPRGVERMNDGGSIYFDPILSPSRTSSSTTTSSLLLSSPTPTKAVPNTSASLAMINN